MFFFFNDNKNELLAALELPHIKELMEADEFYFQKAKDKFDEFSRYDIANIDISALVEITKQSNFSFERWLNSYNLESAEYRLLLLIGQVVSYFDTNAAMKNKLNEYEDKRVLAKAMVRQNKWVKWLLDFKSGADINTFPGNIRNAILFIQNPDANINIISEDYRKTIKESLFKGENPDLFVEMNNLGIIATNPQNNGVLYTWILYSDAIKKLWLEPKDKNSVDNEKEQRAAFKRWYANNGGSVNSAATISTAIGKARLKDGRAVFSIADFEEFSDIISAGGLDGYFEARDGDYSKMDAIFDVESKTQPDDLKNGVKYYLRFLETQNSVDADLENEVNNIDSSYLPAEIVLHHLGGLKETHNLLKRAKLYELNNGSRVLIRGSKLLPAGRYFYGLQNAIVLSDERIDYLIFIKGNEGYYKVPYDFIKGLCLDGSISFADKGKSSNEAVKGYRINLEFNKATNRYELKLIGDKPPISIDEYYHRVESTLSGSRGVRYWIYSPGEQARYWDEFYNEGIFGINDTGGHLGDLTQYSSKTDIKDALQRINNDNKSYKNDSLAFWQFANEISIGDVVYVKKGYSVVLGRGVVDSDYIFDEERSEYKHIRQVNWTHFGEWEHPGQAVQKALTDITPYTEYIEKLEALFGLEIDDDDSETEIIYPEYTREDFLNEVYINAKQYDTMKGLLLRKKNLILQGAPGVGKTFAAERLAFSIMGEKDTSRVKVVQFHQSYSYEDFIMGWRPDGAGFMLSEGPFYKFCKTANDDDERPYFFIIDEINRGNLSKIFGELLMLIEEDKRGKSIRLLYKDEQFSVPKNIHIIGMMNTADRSLAMIDYALRRRFAFFDLTPAFQSEGFIKYQEGIDNPKLDSLISTVEKLNAEISKDASLGDGFRIGHSYFCTNEYSIDDDWLSDVVEYELVPLLNEYWFDEPSKAEGWVKQLRGVVNG
jgi:hypothetical protein